jgi:hypothetical protein
MQTGIIVQHCDTFQQYSSAFDSKSWFQLFPELFTITTSVLLLCLSLGSVRKLALVHPRKVSSLFSLMIEFEFLSDWRYRCFHYILWYLLSEA